MREELLQDALEVLRLPTELRDAVRDLVYGVDVVLREGRNVVCGSGVRGNGAKG